MARARDPNRDKAFQIYKENKGDIRLKDIALQLQVSEGTVRGWKNKDQWEQKLNGTFQSNLRNVPNKKQNKEMKKEVVELDEVGNDGLTNKQRLFVAYYVKCWNATKAYRKAYGCAYSTALTNGPALLGNTRIREEVIRVRDGITQEAILDKRTLVQKWIDIAFADITDYLQFGKTEEISYNEDGQPELDMNGNVKTWTRSFVNLNESEEVDGTLITEVKQGKDGISVKLADKMKALEYLSKHMDLLNDNELKQLKVEREKIAIRKENGDDGEEYEDDGFLDALKGTEVNWDE